MSRHSCMPTKNANIRISRKKTKNTKNILFLCILAIIQNKYKKSYFDPYKKTFIPRACLFLGPLQRPQNRVKRKKNTFAFDGISRLILEGVVRRRSQGTWEFFHVMLSAPERCRASFRHMQFLRCNAPLVRNSLARRDTAYCKVKAPFRELAGQTYGAGTLIGPRPAGREALPALTGREALPTRTSV